MSLLRQLHCWRTRASRKTPEKQTKDLRNWADNNNSYTPNKPDRNYTILRSIIAWIGNGKHAREYDFQKGTLTFFTSPSQKLFYSRPSSATPLNTSTPSTSFFTPADEHLLHALMRQSLTSWLLGSQSRPKFSPRPGSFWRNIVTLSIRVSTDTCSKFPSISNCKHPLSIWPLRVEQNDPILKAHQSGTSLKLTTVWQILSSNYLTILRLKTGYSIEISPNTVTEHGGSYLNG